MKKIILLTLIPLSLLSACKKNSSRIKTEYTVFARKNNAAWAATIPTTITMGAQSKALVSITAKTTDETLNITFNNKGVGKYHLADIYAYYYATIGGDLVTSGYNLSNDASNELVVTSFDEERNIMTGSLNIALVKTYDSSNSLPDKIAFTNGEFKSQINYAVKYTD